MGKQREYVEWSAEEREAMFNDPLLDIDADDFIEKYQDRFVWDAEGRLGKIKEMDYQTQRRLGLFDDENSRRGLYAEIDEPVTLILAKISDDEGSWFRLFNEGKDLVGLSYDCSGTAFEGFYRDDIWIADPRFRVVEAILYWYRALSFRCCCYDIPRKEERELEKGLLLSKEEAVEWFEKNNVVDRDSWYSLFGRVFAYGTEMTFVPPALKGVFDRITFKSREAERTGNLSEEVHGWKEALKRDVEWEVLTPRSVSQD